MDGSPTRFTGGRFPARRRGAFFPIPPRRRSSSPGMPERGGRGWSSGRAKARSWRSAVAQWRSSRCSPERARPSFPISRFTRQTIAARRRESSTTKSEKSVYAREKKSGGQEKILRVGKKSRKLEKNFFREKF